MLGTHCAQLAVPWTVPWVTVRPIRQLAVGFVLAVAIWSSLDAPRAAESVASRRGDREHPIPLHTMAPVMFWGLRIDGVTRHATTLTGPIAPSGKEHLLVRMTAKFTGKGRGYLPYLAARLGLGAKRNIYPYVVDPRLPGQVVDNACGPGRSRLAAPDLQALVDRKEYVRTGESVHGDICFEVASSTASTLKLYVPMPVRQDRMQVVGLDWFAIR
jgi:hypothetical protein